MSTQEVFTVSQTKIESASNRLPDERRQNRGGYSGPDRRRSLTDRRQENNELYTTFYLHSHLIGVEVLKVQEVMICQKMTRVPLASKEIAGLINLRGNVVTSVDLRELMGFPPREENGEVMNIVVKTSSDTLSLMVDKVGDVIGISPTLFEPCPPILDRRLKNVSKGVFKTAEQLLVVLDVEKLFLNTI